MCRRRRFLAIPPGRFAVRRGSDLPVAVRLDTTGRVPVAPRRHELRAPPPPFPPPPPLRRSRRPHHRRASRATAATASGDAPRPAATTGAADDRVVGIATRRHRRSRRPNRPARRPDAVVLVRLTGSAAPVLAVPGRRPQFFFARSPAGRHAHRPRPTGTTALRRPPPRPPVACSRPRPHPARTHAHTAGVEPPSTLVPPPAGAAACHHAPRSRLPW